MTSFVIGGASAANQALTAGETGAVLPDGAIIAGPNAVDVNDATLFVAGLILAPDGAAVSGSGDVTLVTAASGSVVGAFAFAQLSGPGSVHTITNAGLMQGESDAVYIDNSGGVVLTNTGTITGTVFNAMNITSTGNVRIVNDGQVNGTISGIILNGTATIDILNTGSITADNAIFSNGSGVMAVTNSGTILGSVTLGSNNDRFDGRGGDQSQANVNGGAGNDTLIGSDGYESFEGDIGNDRIRAYGDHDDIYGGDGDDNIRGGDGDDYCEGGTGNDELGMGFGDDYVTAGDGNDSLRGAAGTDELYGDAGNDTLLGGLDNDLLDGGDGKDLVRGDAGDDLLNGGGSGDTLDGGRGDDTLNGGSSADVFVFGTGNGADQIDAFSNNSDRIDLDAFNFANVAAVVALAQTVQTGLLIDLSSVGGGSIVITSGLTLAQLDAADLIL